MRNGAAASGGRVELAELPAPRPHFRRPFPSAVIFVHNLNSARTTDAALAEFFAAVGRVEAARVFQGQDSGFVRYTSQYDAARAMERLQGCVFNGKPLQLTSGQQVQAAYSQVALPAMHRTASPGLLCATFAAARVLAWRGRDSRSRRPETLLRAEGHLSPRVPRRR